MKLFRFGEPGKEKPGVHIGEKHYDISSFIGDYNEGFFTENGIEKLKTILQEHFDDLVEIPYPFRFGPVIHKPETIICIGLNFRDHAIETNAPIPAEPIVFFKATTAICGPNDDLILTLELEYRSIADRLAFPERLIVIQFSTPVHLMPVVEVLHGDNVEEQVFERTFRFLKLLGKKPVEVKREVSGFILSTLSSAIFREAQHILEQGIASNEDIDKVVMFDLGRKFSITGLFVAADMAGLGVCSSISNRLYPHLSVTDCNSNTFNDLVNNNRLGRKTGEGYYLWNSQSLNKTDTQIEKQFIRFLKQDALD